MTISQKKTYENGRIPWFKGKVLFEEHRRKIGQSLRRRPSSSKGRTLTQELKDRISLANAGRKHTQEEKKRISEGLIAYHKKVVSERRSQGLLRYYQSHDVWNKGLTWPDEIREKIREGYLNSPLGMGPRLNQTKENSYSSQV